MILESGEDFAGIIRDKWTGLDVLVSKTVPAPDIRIKVENARVLGWKEMNRTIREKHGPDTGFLVITGSGRVSGVNNESKTQLLIIALEGDTVYDVRDNRLVVLTQREVVEIRPADGHPLSQDGPEHLPAP